ncbi:hypothetical protein [Lactiplantibacillus mudanjiangensis]|uniref:Uncharacterized protein n=1 Tax=Lactiplantibacillus mudanjiangensis TaxID=1296538 RepID=A0A660EAF4_9LACO|nr:hypothetical protein [Lactiplantibacillus mudanjiangensis]VDG18571.1 hypothetical protein MUDAN_BIHEEGNE_03411 [Lactiplantibacillus mudanjiangensis]VDG24209.1 hypothetical protein MUDAN_IGPPGNFN_02478 [Lactiplantibacillus mudanjiangensis]VDG30187.1 hypothetical protein MUDAN_MDHGFNIF_01740 [Lactiplantibacillus mudanjiangensis]
MHINSLAGATNDCFQKLKNLGGVSEANMFLLYAYLQLWSRVGAPVHVVHIFDKEAGEDIFIARFSKD